VESPEKVKTANRQQRLPNLVLVRHGKPVIEDGVRPAQWRLSEAGYEASWALGQKLRDEGFNIQRIVSSPEIKALNTAIAIAASLGGDTEVETNANLSEHARESTDFLPRSEFEEAIAHFLRDDPSQLVFGEETADAAFQRFATAIQQEKKLRESSGEEASDIIVATHGTILSLYVGRILGIDPFPFWQELRMPLAVVISKGNQLSIVNAAESSSRWRE